MNALLELNAGLQKYHCQPLGNPQKLASMSICTLWFMTTLTFVKNFRVYLGNKIYFASQLCYDINEGLNSNTTDLTAGGIFVYAYDEATRTVEYKIKEGLNYKVKIPTDTELTNYVNGLWDSVSAPYDNRDPVSINYLLSNYVPTNGGLTAWTSSYLNLVPFRSVMLHCPELADHHYSSP